MTDGVSDTRVEKAYKLFLKYADVSSPKEAADDLEAAGMDPQVVEAVRQKHEAETIRIRNLDQPPSVWRNGRVTWYTGPKDNDKNWPAIEKSMRQKDFGDANIASVDEASTKIVSLLDHPKQNEFRTRGLVVGFVQSGKTTNFTAVMAKAADRGYKLFIVLSGIHNTLRRQTQLRLGGDLVVPNQAQWYEITTPQKDFTPPGGNAKAYFAAKDQTMLLVVKKNAPVLRKLRDWLDSADEYLTKIPTLIIDDEADQSTVATAKINPLLYEVMSKFPKVGYIGYTATPFANLLINPGDDEDFYPRDFVVNLPQPTGYHGTEVLFGRDLLPGDDPEDLEGGFDMIRTVPDDEVDELKPRTKKEAADFYPGMSHSLRRAVEWFWLATAARRVRGGGNPHSTMLIHTTTDTTVHGRFKDPLLDLRARMLRGLDARDPDLLDRLRDTWARETALVPAVDLDESPVSFAALREKLPEVVQATKVVIDNYRSTDRLDYESGPVTAIAVGGNTLSRGLTLEGLVSSLFVRAVSAYDTLLQMGRWFGYRNHYPDLPRIWMTDELKDWFSHLATVEAEMRQDIDRYMNPGVDPLNFAVRLRTHPKMSITAKAKMTSAVRATAAYGGLLVESRFFDVSDEGKPWLAGNAEAARELIARAGEDGIRAQSRDETVLFTDVPHDDVLQFLSAYSFHERSTDADPGRIAEYIRKRVRAGALGRWSIGVIGNSQPGADTKTCRLGDGVEVRMVRRSRMPHEGDGKFDGVADIKTLSSRRDEALDLDVPSASGMSRKELLELRKAKRPTEGLLLLYPIEPRSEPRAKRRVPLDAPTDDVVMGVALVFPEPKDKDSDVEYMSADLSQVVVEEEDLSILDQDDE
ncbi:Z1 domain-containing protein [Pseudonocardia oroxyli]|uniref:Z1 domain-containing protein n=1 Tax=Pseudonocardia oroxyli TaxID=366584 RepID=A0A1G7PA80_PSEOR|nr:Z1 domain-containing protein [Pseudonocardia oroxyli]SDF83027.1 Z1 domain-containing protein [Pseudonocardia oroxyli]